MSIVEAAVITGPMKPLLMFSQLARRGFEGHPAIEHSVLTTARPAIIRGTVRNQFLKAADDIGLDADIVPEGFLFDPRVLWRMARRMHARNPDIVETHDFKSHFLFWILRHCGVARGARWIAFHHGYTKMSWKVRVYQQLDRLSLRAADRVVTLCCPFVQQLRDRGVPQQKIRVTSNAVELRQRIPSSELQKLRLALGIHHGECVIACVGRLSKEKGHADLIKAFQVLLESTAKRQYRLLFVGDGGERGSLQSQAVALGDRVLFAGHQPDPWPYYCVADIFVLPSHTEGSPLVLFEAMSAGLPIVATSVGGVPEVVRDGREALLVAANDIVGLERAIECIASNATRAREMGAACLRRVADYSPATYARRILSLYADVLQLPRSQVL